MRLRVVAVGRLKSGPERDLVDRYAARTAALARGLGFSGPDLVELAEGRGRRPEERRSDEAGRLRPKMSGSTVVLLDEGGPSLTSDAFAARLAGWRDGGRPTLSFVVGGPDGLAPDLAGEADAVLAFGRMTLPHQIVRVLVLEQLYRALTILSGHPYHRGAGEDG